MRTRTLGLGSQDFMTKNTVRGELRFTKAPTTSTRIQCSYKMLTAEGTVTSGSVSERLYGTTIEALVKETLSPTIFTTMKANGWVFEQVAKDTVRMTHSALAIANDASPIAFSLVDTDTGLGFVTTVAKSKADSTDMYGYYGKYQGIVTPRELISLVGITEGTTKDDTYNKPDEPITWLKFSHNYKTLFVADRTIHRSMTWAHLDALGLIRGRVVEFDGIRYLLRVLQGATCNPAHQSEIAISNSNAEFYSLLVEFLTSTEANWGGVNANTAGGKDTLCQETMLSNLNAVLAANPSVMYGYNSYLKDAISTDVGYRPVLEVL